LPTLHSEILNQHCFGKSTRKHFVANIVLQTLQANVLRLEKPILFLLTVTCFISTRLRNAQLELIKYFPFHQSDKNGPAQNHYAASIT
jgi:hypothetical protein